MPCCSISGESKPDNIISQTPPNRFPQGYKRLNALSTDFLSRCAAPPSSFSYLSAFRPGAVVIRSFLRPSLSPCSQKLLSPPSSSVLFPPTLWLCPLLALPILKVSFLGHSPPHPISI